MSQIDTFVQRGSGWVLDEIKSLDLHVTGYRPVTGSSYIPLPDRLKGKQAIINIQNDDDRCFMWSVLAAKHPTMRDRERVANYQFHADELDFTGISFPVAVQDIPKFEAQNNLSINVYGFEDEEGLCVYHLTNHYDGRPQIHLLLLIDGEKQHYCLIKSLETLFLRQNRHHGRKFYCHRCLCHFYTEAQRCEHQLRCENKALQRVLLPDQEKDEHILTFKAHAKR